MSYAASLVGAQRLHGWRCKVSSPLPHYLRERIRVREPRRGSAEQALTEVGSLTPALSRGNAGEGAFPNIGKILNGGGTSALRHALVTMLAVVSLHAGAASAREVLPCGTPLQRHLDAGAEDEFALSPSADSIVVVSVVDRSQSPSLLRIKAEGGLETCSGSLSLAASPGTTIEVSDCIGNDAIDYAITANVVSGGNANCALPLPCGLVPYVREWKVPGEVDSYRFQAAPGEDVVLRTSDMSDNPGTVSIQVFDPEGTAVNGAGSCGGEVRFLAGLDGSYTALVTSCVEARSGHYLLAYLGGRCPAGPEISYFGIARTDGLPIDPLTYDAQGRPVYTRVGGAGFTLVIEAKRGADQADPGLVGFDYDAGDPTVLPDLQVLFSLPLGNGIPAVCAEDPSARDGIPATQPLVFAESQPVSDAINDFGCHIDDGTRHAMGVNLSVDACTTFPDGSSHFVAADSTTQFCAQIPGIRQFQSGDTTVAARVRDNQGVVGPVREIIVRIQDIPTPTPTPSRTPTTAMSATPTPRAIACVGDCNHDTTVSFDEIATTLRMALNDDTLACAAIDADRSGFVSVDEIVRAVHAGSAGCPPS